MIDDFEPVPQVEVEAETKPMREEPKKKEPEIERTPTILVSNTDAYIWERMKSQPKDIDALHVEVLDKPEDPKKHRLSLPDELLPYEKKYVFRWIYKSKRAIDEACDIRGWTLVNRSYFGDLPNYLYTVNGSIERGDNILAFMPKEKAEYLRKIPGQKSREVMQATFDKHKDDPNYYVPKDEESSEVIGI